MKEKKHLDPLYNFAEIDNTEDRAEVEGCDTCYDKVSELRRLTYKIEDNTAEMMNYNSIIETSKKSLKSAKKDYEKAKKEYDAKSFGALVFDILTFLCAFFSGYFFVKWLLDKDSVLFETLLYVFLAATALTLLIALYKNYKVRPLRKKMKRAKELMRDSKTWIAESERGMKQYEDENRALKRQRKGI